MSDKKTKKSILTNIEEILIVIMMIIIIAITFINVVSRKFLTLLLSFTEEITINLLVFIVFLGASIATKNKAHLGLTILTDALPLKAKKIVETFVMLIITIFFALVCYEGFVTIAAQIELNQKTPALGAPEWVFSLSVPLGSLLLIFRFIEVWVKEMNKKEI